MGELSAANDYDAVASELKTIEANRVARIMDRIREARSIGAGVAFNAAETESLSRHLTLLTYEAVRSR